MSTTVNSAKTADYEGFLIGGEWVKPASDGVIVVESATTGERLGSTPDGTAEDVDSAVQAARSAFDAADGWPTWEPKRRAEAMIRLAEALDARTDETAVRVSAQNGNPISATRQYEGQVPARLLRYYAELIQEMGEERRGSTIVRSDPIGVVGAIPPFNSPQVLAFLKIAPGVAAGCTFVMKPSSETVLDSYTLAEALIESDFPAGVLNI